jgi:hypothetical protein
MSTLYSGYTESVERIEERKRRILADYQPEPPTPTPAPLTIWEVGGDVFAVVGNHDEEGEA